jgi:hypothetical protein
MTITPHLEQADIPGTLSFQWEDRRLLRRCFEVLLLGSAAMIALLSVVPIDN